MCNYRIPKSNKIHVPKALLITIIKSSEFCFIYRHKRNKHNIEIMYMHNIHGAKKA